QAFANTGADCEQQDDRAMIGAAEAQVIPYELAGGHRGLRGYTIQARRSWDVAEARWIAIHNLYALHGCAYDVADRDGVRDQLPASDVEQRRRLSDRECSRDLQVERNVVVVDLVRAGYGGAIQIEIQVVPSPRAARRHGGWRRELRSLCFAVRDARKRITRTGRHRERRGRCVGSCRNDLRLTGHIDRPRGHLDKIAAAGGAGGVPEGDFEGGTTRPPPDPVFVKPRCKANPPGRAND